MNPHDDPNTDPLAFRKPTKQERLREWDLVVQAEIEALADILALEEVTVWYSAEDQVLYLRNTEAT